jgi:hypothetical protein
MNSITSRDREIVNWVSIHKSITIDQCRKIFMPGCSSGYKIAQRRLNKLVENGYLKMSKTDTNENVYYTDKKLSYHDLLINSFYASLINCGAKNIVFAHPQKWLNGKVISDAFLSYDYGQYTFYNILEVCVTHKKINIEGYEELYNSGEAHQLCGNTFPRIIVMDDVEHFNLNNYHSDLLTKNEVQIIQVDYSLNNLPLIFMD